MADKVVLTVEATVNVSVEKAWKMWTEPEHITQWYFASPDWHAPSAQNDVRSGGKFTIRMEAKDGSVGFDLVGSYDTVVQNELIDGALGDGRKLTIRFASNGDSTDVSETFETESIHPVEFQKAGWQAILNNFKSYAESAQI